MSTERIPTQSYGRRHISISIIIIVIIITI